jgi:hypothetical protein
MTSREAVVKNPVWKDIAESEDNVHKVWSEIPMMR